MSTWKELGRFLERSTPLLEVGLESLKDTRTLLAALRPTVDALPALVHETHGLVTDARALLRDVAPLVVEAVRAALAERPAAAGGEA